MTIKRLLIIIGILFIILLGVSVYAVAVLLPNATPTSLSTLTPTPVKIPPATEIASVRRVIGTIQSIGNQTFVVALTYGKKTVTVNVNDKTNYTTPSGTATFSDLRVGEMVEVRGRSDSLDSTTILAASVIIKQAAA